MASVYRFTRKSKKEDAKNDTKQALEENKDLSPLMTESDPSPAEEIITPSPEKEEKRANEEAVAKEMIAEEEAEKTREISFAKEEAQKEDSKVSKEDTIDFETAMLEAMNTPEETDDKEELLRALEQTQKIDAQKFDEIFGRKKGETTDHSAGTDGDEATALLKEIFGLTSSKLPNVGGSENPELQEEIQGVFSEGKTLQEALADARKLDESEKDDSQYIAVHDAPSESTKEYHATFSFEEELENITPEALDFSVPPFAQEVHVSDGDDIYSDTYDELEEKAKKLELLPEEYTSEEEFDEFAEDLRNRNFTALRNAIWSFLAFLAVLYLESATFSDIWHPEFLKPDGLYGTIFLLVDIQLLLISALLALPSLGEGVRSLFQGKPSRNTAAFFAVFVAILHAVLLMIFSGTDYPLFGCVSALFVWMTTVADFLDAKRIHRTFRVCGRHGEKIVAEKLGEDSAEAEAFREQLSGTPKFYSVCKADFIEHFFKRVKSRSKADCSHGWGILLSFLFAAGFAAFSYWKGADLTAIFNRFAMMTMMTLPLSGIFTVVLPFSHLSKKAERKNAAIISAAMADEYSAADVVSFTDKEIFPPKSVKITTIRTYGQTRIDKAILYGAMIFQKLGGPLSLVFKKTISGVYTEIPENFDFLEITADGMCAKIDGKDVFVGNKNYLLSYDFGYTKDDIDDAFEARSGKIMYMVINSELAAKFYIRYSISKRFKKTVFTLFKSGICPAVKTCDPNIDSDLFRTLLQNDKIPAGIIKTCEAMKDAPNEERSESGVVCTSSIANLLHTFSLCDSLKHLSQANVVIKLLSLLLGAGIVIFLFFIEDLAKITGLFVLLYQLLWMIPVIIPSLSE
ncbi:MAG: hypothetical protein IKT50_05090 [Clostridia bacterium]|nr:hypothetical protein [Clostridia bacterium]